MGLAGMDRQKMRNDVGLRRESSVPKNVPDANISAHTFTFRELVAATQNFRDECFLGEGGFGRVYKGRLENGQVGSCHLIITLIPWRQPLILLLTVYRINVNFSVLQKKSPMYFRTNKPFQKFYYLCRGN